MKPIDPALIPKRRQSASLSRLSPIEGVMVAFDAGVYVRLNESAMLVWDLVDGERSVANIADHLAERFAISAVVALEDTQTCLDRLVELQVVDV